MKPLHELTGVEAAQAIAAGTITSEVLVTACLEQIAAREESVRAWEYLAPEAALAQARARDRSPAQGPLCLLYTSPSPRDRQKSRMPSSA